MGKLSHEIRFQETPLSERFQAVSVELCRDYPKGFIRALSVAVLLMDMGADESEVVIGMVSAAEAWDSVEMKLSEAKACGKIRVFLGVAEENPEYDDFVLEDSALDARERLIADALVACRLREALDYYRHRGIAPQARDAEEIVDLIDRYCVAREYLGETELAANVEYYLREIAKLLPEIPTMLKDDCNVWLLKGTIPDLLVQVVRAVNWPVCFKGQCLAITARSLTDNAELLRFVGLVVALWPDIKVERSEIPHLQYTWEAVPDEQLNKAQKRARGFCQKLFELAPNPFAFPTFLEQARFF